MILEEGRHELHAPEMQFVGVQNASKDTIKWSFSALTLVRVRPGNVALAFVRGKPVALPPREHFYEFLAPDEQFIRLESTRPDTVKLDAKNSLDIVRVRPGTIGLMYEQGEPVVLTPSKELYQLRAPSQLYIKTVDVMRDIISIDDENSLDIIRVRPSYVGLVWEDSKPRMLAPRADPYVLRKPRHQFVGLSAVTEEHIELGSLHVITIATGRRGVVWIKGKAAIIEAGQSTFYEENFKFGGSALISDKQYSLGPFTYVTAGSGEIGIKHKFGELEILYAGTHCLAADRGETFHGFVSIQQQVMKVSKLRVITLDNVELNVDAVLTYSISNPERAIRGVKNLEDVLRQRTETTLSNIFSHNNYGQMQKQKNVPTARQISEDDAPRSAQRSATERADEYINKLDNKDIGTLVHDEFMSMIKDTAENVWGVSIGDLSVDNIRVSNADLAHDLEQRAVTTVKTATARANAENQAKVELIKADADARAKALQAQGNTAQAIAQAEAQAKIIKAKAIAEAEAARIKAEGEAKALKIMAEARAAARVAEAEAEKKATQLEAKGAEVLGKNAMLMRQWRCQQEMAVAMFKNQRTFIDTQNMPQMAELLTLNQLGGMGMLNAFKKNSPPSAKKKAGAN